VGFGALKFLKGNEYIYIMNMILQESSFVEGIVNSVVKDRRKEKLMENKVKKNGVEGSYTL
jgi:hypothetical protein